VSFGLENVGLASEYVIRKNKINNINCGVVAADEGVAAIDTAPAVPNQQTVH